MALLPVTSTAQPSLDKGLVAYYPFNGNAVDISGNKNNPLFNNATLTTDRYGKGASAYYFNGKDSYIRIPNHPSLNFSQQLSLCAWVKVSGFYQGDCHGNSIIMKGNRDDRGGNYFLRFDDGSHSRWQNCSIAKPDKDHQNFYGIGFSASGGYSPYIKNEQWYCLVYTCDGITARFYLDGVLKSTETTIWTNFRNKDDLFFGKMNDAQFPYWFHGAMDEIRIYNRAISLPEIRLLCKLPAIPPNECDGTHPVSAAFDYTVSECNKVSFRLDIKDKKDLAKVKWNFGDGHSSHDLSPVHTYSKAGLFKVRAIVTNRYHCTDTFTKTIRLEDLNIDFVFAEEENSDAIRFSVKNNKASYTWEFGDGETIKNESITKHAYKKGGDYTVRLLARNAWGCRDSAMKNITIASKDPVIIQTTEFPVESLPPMKIDFHPEQRNKEIAMQVPVEQDSVKISLYDNGVVDGDSITLIFNDNIILTHQALGERPLTFFLKIDKSKSNNELLMYAENLGAIPPNTALMIIYDGEKRYEVNVSSNKTRNGVISFIIRK